MKETKCFQKFIGKAINAAFILFIVMSVTFIATQANAESHAGKKVLLIDSYHVGYPWSDGITAGVKEVLDKAGVEYKIINMDTKKNKSKEFKEGAALKAKEVIESYKPDVVIAADDNASKFLINLITRTPLSPLYSAVLTGMLRHTDFPIRMLLAW